MFSDIDVIHQNVLYLFSSAEGPAMSSQAATALAFFNQQKPENNWPDPDLSVLDDRRGPVPAVPARAAAGTVARLDRRDRAGERCAGGLRAAVGAGRRGRRVQPDPAYRDKPGRPTSHWQFNPALAES